jgi:glycosyltransferase involved in cell wall biosynthesis
VISSNTSSLPEVVGEAGLLVDPHDHQALATAMQALLSDAARRAVLSRAGLERARRFSWERTIAAVTAVYRAALSQPPEACRA